MKHERFVSDVDQRVLVARQIRLYIENSPVFYPLTVIIGYAVAAAVMWPIAPGDHAKLVLWAGFIAATVLARYAGWVAYSRAKPDDDAVRSWLKWFLGPQVCSMMMIGAGPFFFLPASSGHDFEILAVLAAGVYVAALASSLKSSTYRPVIPSVLIPMVLVFAAGVFRLPGIVPALSALGAVGLGLLGYVLASRTNQAFVRSMELTIRNEQLVTALEAHTAQLQQQTLALQQQTLVAEKARQAAEQAERDKTRFIASASHDLRQPMHAISLLVGLLRSRASDGPGKDVTERLERSVEAMDNLFNTILDLSKLDSRAVQPAIAEVSLRSIFDSIEVHFAPQAASKRLALRVFRSRAIVRTDRVLLERVLRNLVSNAIKYTDEGRVLVSCRRRRDRMMIGVWDTGAGIAPHELERIFDEYFQIGGGTRDRSEGLGLGLSIVRRLGRLLGSDVKVASTLGRGSWFGVEVPFVRYLSADERHDDRHSMVETSLQNKFILIVDDEAEVRFGAEALLREWGCHTACASSVADVEARLDDELRFPDAIVTDYRLGAEETGLDAIAAVRKYTREDTPAIIVTGENLGKDELGAAGAICPIIKKPLSADELRKHLVAALSSEEARS